MTWWNYIENYPNLPGKLVLRPLLGKRNQGHHAQMAIGCPLIEARYTNGNLQPCVYISSEGQL